MGYLVERTKVLCAYCEWKIGDLDCYHISEVAKISIWGQLVSTQEVQGEYIGCILQFVHHSSSCMALNCHLVFQEWRKRKDCYLITCQPLSSQAVPSEVCVICLCGLCTIFISVIL